MKKTIKVINELKRKGIIEDYTIAGGIALIYYIEPILTYDLDIFFINEIENKKLVSLSPIYNYLKKKGYRTLKEHIVIEGIPVQFIPVYNELVKTAVKDAKKIQYKGVETKILRPEYLVAIMLQVFRPKDKERIIMLLDQAKVDKRRLNAILKKHKLTKKFKDFQKLYGK